MKLFNQEGGRVTNKGNGFDRWLSAFLLGLVVLAFCTGSLSFWENKLQDSVYQQPGIVSPDIYVVGIDAETLKDRTMTGDVNGKIEYGQGGLGPFQTWTRADIANLINKLNEDPDNKPAVIGVDILFSGQKTKEEDEALVQAAKNGGNVVVGVQATFGTKLSQDQTYLEQDIKDYEEPFSALKAVTDRGHINVMPDADGVIRKGLYSIEVDGKEIPSFSAAIVKKYNQYWGVTQKINPPPTDADGQWYLTYTGEPGEFFGTEADGTSVIRVLRGEIDPAMFAGSIVLIGPYSFGMMDSYYTPIHGKEQMHGVEIHANVIQALMEENYKIKPPAFVEIVLLLAMGFISIFLSRRLDLRVGAIFVALSCVGYIFFARWIFSKGIILTLLYPILLFLVLYVTQVGINYVVERKEKQKIKDIFKKYVDPKLVEKLILSGEADNNEVGKTKDIAVLFVDIRGFTPMSEQLKDKPETLVCILNDYLELTSRCIFDNGGSVDKFIGDATMALFNGFVPLEDYEYKAACAAWDIVEGAQELNERILKKYGINVGFGVGINCGTAVVGNLGPSFRKDFTAIGDTVNTAARLESNAAAGKVLLGSALYERLKQRISAKSIGEIPLKGKTIGLMVYELEGLEPRKEQMEMHAGKPCEQEGEYK